MQFHPILRQTMTMAISYLILVQVSIFLHKKISKCLFVMSNTTKLVFVVSVELLKEYYFLYLNSVGHRVFQKIKG